jgi:predicted  nucleic acid-binding Zn-ribbon protein
MANLTPRCWNCGRADKWTEVAAMERCDNCGIACFYHGSGANDAYRAATEAKYVREERLAEEAEQREYWREEQRRHDQEEGEYY